MNKISPPKINDAAAFETLANNPKVGSHPHLQGLVDRAQASYKQYEAARGIPIFVLNPLCQNAAKFLKGHYAAPPADLAHITEMRESTEHLVCPMCGSMHSGTLDHYLPKDSFPIFATFSKNLVPACKCNSKRGQILLGSNAGERILHPYYDTCLQDRLIKAQFNDLGEVPSVSIALTIPITHPNYAAVNFHVQKIVLRSAIRKYLADRWSSMFRKPSLVVRALSKNIATLSELKDILLSELDALDDLHKGKNNWNSIFVSGLLDPPVLTWLTDRLSDAHRVPDSPLG